MRKAIQHGLVRLPKALTKSTGRGNNPMQLEEVLSPGRAGPKGFFRTIDYSVLYHSSQVLVDEEREL